MGFRDQGDQTFFDLIRYDRATGKREIMKDQDPIEGRWAAEAALKRAIESNRNPNVSYEVHQARETKPKFRAAAFGDATERIPAFKPSDITKK